MTGSAKQSGKPQEAETELLAQFGQLCTSEDTAADKRIDACNKIIALKVFSGDDPPNQRH